ncbi:multidrug effflux MFS transporter [Amycolatopsis jiangsuensis]|uniref:DHA1 family bicyclomycin/chloramphenicol resistance-like MFS transporter n=1 Tax=Amycolatopsis jiangsuensis TaxID=1181879 RepID=A0A840IS37_9PSEU|nr:multidrug effflux MFS transporter [Amycolatopsis jiangsuensis]MBB4685411.1 DHA1 family bicyclomycin/chloramphenicol resistance-like MFS transporter [Amycolatopsis jiangsuensis]
MTSGPETTRHTTGEARRAAEEKPGRKGVPTDATTIDTATGPARTTAGTAISPAHTTGATTDTTTSPHTSSATTDTATGPRTTGATDVPETNASAGPRSSARPARRWSLLLILGGLSAFGPLSIDMYLPALPRMAADLRAPDTTVQLTLTAFVVGLAIGQIVAGPLSDALGRRRPLLAGLVLYAAGSVLAALSPGIELLIAARVLEALGAAAGLVISRATVRDLYSGTAMTKFFSMLMLVNGLAPILAPVIGGQLLTFTSWRGVFVVLTAFGLLLLVSAAVALPEPLPAERRRPARLGGVLRTYGHLLADRTFLGYALAASLLFASLFAYISGSSFALQGVYGLSPQLYSLVFGLNGVGIVLAGQLNGRLVGRFAERNLLLTGLTIAAVAGTLTLTATLLALPLPGVLIPLLFMVSSVGLVMPNASSLALDAHARSAGSAAALLGVLQFAIGAIATPLVGLGGPGTAVPMAATMAGFGVLALLASALTRPGRRGSRPGAARP